MAGSTLGQLGSGAWTHPLPGATLTSRYGYRGCIAGIQCNEYVSTHRGLDFSTGGGAQVIAPADVQITATGANQYQGHYVVARQLEEPRVVFQFHHCQASSIQVSRGDTAAVGTGLCREGTTGNSSRTHLHFQVNTPEADDTRPTYDHATDPYPLLTQKGLGL